MAKVIKPAVLVTTPESLDVMLFKDESLLSEVRALIVDEAHLLYNTQRGMQLAVLTRRIELANGRKLQVAALSATIGSTESLWSFFRPERLPQVVDDKRARLVHRTIRLGWTAQRLGQTLREVRDGRPGGVKVLVFTDSRAECDSLAAELRDSTGLGDAVFAHHSSLSKDERLRTRGAVPRTAHGDLCRNLDARTRNRHRRYQSNRAVGARPRLAVFPPADRTL